MNREAFDAIVFASGDRFFGMDVGEVRKITLRSGVADRGRDIVDRYRRQASFYSLDRLFAASGAEGEALVEAARGERSLCCLEVPRIETIVRVPPLGVLPVPPLVRLRQNPLFIWGMFPHGAAPVTLITFVYFGETGDG